MGGQAPDPQTLKDALLLGERIAQRGCVVLTGGGPGVMKAASEGASRAGGLVVGILPSERGKPLDGYPNEFVDIAIYTGMSDARNAINVKTSHVLIALQGGAGTLSEIVLAIKTGTPVICLHDPGLTHPATKGVIVAETVEGVMEALDRMLASL